MKKVFQLKSIPDKSLILNGFEKTDYFDTYAIEIKADDCSVDKIATDLFQSPRWAQHLLKLRDAIVRRFGLKTSDQEDIQTSSYYAIGHKLVYFTVTDRNENEIVMGENDKHLNFRTSVLIDQNNENSTIYLSTVVRFNNFFGRLYFFPVKPFHRIIIKSMLKKYGD